MKKIVMKAFSKLNLALYVMPAVGGYHGLESLVVTVDVFDTVTVAKREDDVVTVRYVNDSIPKESDTVLKAAGLFLQRCGGSGVDVCVQKGIRQKAGMGGSSVDAAAVLFALKRFYGAKDEEVRDIAAQIGSDVNYLMTGGLAVLSGKGDHLTLLDEIPTLHFVVAYCGEGLSTKEVFQRFDELGVLDDRQLSHEKCLSLAQSLKQNRTEKVLFCNSLQRAANSLCPELEAVKGKAAALGVGLSLTGSGSAMFALCRDAQEAERTACKLRQEGIDAKSCRSVPYGIEICSEE